MGRTRRAPAAVAVVVALAAAVAGCGSSRGTTAIGADPSDPQGAVAASSSTGGDAEGGLRLPCGRSGIEPDGGGEVGVTAETLTIGYGDDAGSQLHPGTGSEASAVVRALVERCNEVGGINGRRIEAVPYDGATTDPADITGAGCDRLLALVGEAFAADGGGEAARVECGLPLVPALVSDPAVATGPSVVEAVPDLPGTAPGAGLRAIAAERPEAVARAAVVYGDDEAARAGRDAVVAAATAAGWTMASCNQSFVPDADTDWGPFVDRLSSCGITAVRVVGAGPDEVAALVGRAEAEGYRPLWVLDGVLHGPALPAALEQADATGAEVVVDDVVGPFDEAEPGTPVGDYVVVAEGVDAAPSSLGLRAASAFILWATTVARCGTTVDRACLLDRLSEVEAWEGGGLHPATGPWSGAEPACAALVAPVDGRFSWWGEPGLRCGPPAP